MFTRTKRKNGVAAGRGMTLLEVLIAMFIFMVGIVGVMAAIPSGITSAEWVIFQDASLHLVHSKFSEFRRDRIDPPIDLTGPYLTSKHGKAKANGWREFLYENPADANAFDNDTYKYFDDVQRYEWTVEVSSVSAGVAGTPAPPPNMLAPTSGAGTPIGLTKVVIRIRMKGTTREFRFTQYMFKYDA